MKPEKIKELARRQAIEWRARRPKRLTRTVAALFDVAAASGRDQDYKLARQCGDGAKLFLR